MKLSKITDWLDATLDVAAFDDVSNNGVQIARMGDEIRRVAFAVDASVKSVCTAAAAGAELLVVHHGISWGGGVKRLAGGVYNVVKAAMDANLAVYACHLPLDAHPTLGNNAQLAQLFGLKKTRPAFSWRGRPIGVVGECDSYRVGICSGGGGDFVEEAKRLGCDVFVTGEADWGEVIAAENIGLTMLCCGHYETEVYGIRALAVAMKKALKINGINLT